MTAKEFNNYLEALALNQTVDNRLYSHAEGRGATASGYYSHAEGAYTIAEGYCNCDGNALLDDAKLEEGWDWLDHDVD